MGYLYAIRYANNPKVMHIMDQLRRTRAVVQAYGQYQIQFQQLLAGGDIELTKVAPVSYVP